MSHARAGDSLAPRALRSLERRLRFEAFALRAVLKVSDLLALAFGHRLAVMRDSEHRHLRSHGRHEELVVQLRLAWECAQILAGRWEKIPERHRPFYTPEQRFRILRLKKLLVLSQEETAGIFQVSRMTIGRWEMEAGSDPKRESAGSLVRPSPPVRRFADVARETVKVLALVGLGGNDTIAMTLARAGWKISARTIGRIRKEKSLPLRPAEAEAPRTGRALRARFPLHILMADLTDIPGLFRLFSFKLAAVFDAFSRFPLAFKVFEKEPTAGEMAGLVRKTARRHGFPRHFVSDQGPCFKATRFRGVLRRLGIRQRFGAVGKTGSIALIERFWRTVKERLRPFFGRPLLRQDLERRVGLVLLHYAYFRPHQGLGGATPAEVYFGQEPAHLSAVPPPRGRPGERAPDPPVEVRFLDPERTLPILVKRAA
jgi:transposase InsO family protein/DNA-binding XRE family transcriptional regulator